MIVLLVVGLLAGASWIVGFVRAVRNEPINRRLREYGTRRER